MDMDDTHTDSPEARGPYDPGTSGSSNSKPGADAASQALVDALKWCFRLLKVIMIIAVVLYLASGVFRVQPDQVALKLRFGEVLGAGPERELKSGLHWSFPWPIESKIIVPKGKLRSVTSEFWYKMTEQEKIRGPSKQVGGTLRPGNDHFVLTGDANILHVNATVRYRIIDAYGYVRNISGAEDPSAEPERDLIVALADTAIIRAAGKFGVDDLLTVKRGEFSTEVQKYLRESLAELDCGLELEDVLIDNIVPPRQVVRYFIEVRHAAEERREKEKVAQGDAVKLLTETAGEGYPDLVEAIERERRLLAGNEAGLEEARKTTVELLNLASGSVQDILSEAKIYREQLEKAAEADAEYLKNLLPEFQKHPRVLVTRLLLDALEDLLGKVRKSYVYGDLREVRVHIDRDPQELERETGTGQEKNEQRNRGE